MNCGAPKAKAFAACLSRHKDNNLIPGFLLCGGCQKYVGNAYDVQFTNMKQLCLQRLQYKHFVTLLPKHAKVSALTLLRANVGPVRPPAQKVNATCWDCEPPQGFLHSHMDQQICQGGPATPI